MGRICVVVLVCLVLPVPGVGQVKGEEVMEAVLESVVERMDESGDEAVVEEMMEVYERYRESPLDINGASREELEHLHLLSDFQVESLLEHRSSSGNILSAAELQLVNGFGREVVNRLLPFIAFGNGKAGWAHRGKSGGYSTLLLKSWFKVIPDNQEYLGASCYTQIKYRWELPHRLQGGFILEKDVGEKIYEKDRMLLGDFFSFHLSAKDIRLKRGFVVSNAVLGDYTVRMGQGLVLWNAFSLQGDDNPNNSYRRGPVVVPYMSSDENRFFRGAAVTVKKVGRGMKELETTLFCSRKDVDARVEGGVYTSLPKDGLHNTESLDATRKKLGELVYGARVSLRTPLLRVGVNYAGYGYNAHNGRRVAEYNRYQMYDGQYGNFSADAAAVLGRFRCFAEVACDYGGAVALLCGAVAVFGKWEVSGIFRNYPKDYIAPYAGAYSSTSSCSNQRGASVIAGRQVGNIGVKIGGELVHYPWCRYNVPDESRVYRLWGRFEHKGYRANLNGKVYSTYDSYGGKLKFGAKGVYGTNVCEWLRIRFRGETSLSFQELGRPAEYGLAAGADAAFTIAEGKASVALRCLWYNCSDWDTRLYVYENDLPSSYVSTLLYGRGIKWFLLFNCKVGKNTTAYVKADGDSKIKLGLKMRFF